jgi:hypothetical protein
LFRLMGSKTMLVHGRFQLDWHARRLKLEGNPFSFILLLKKRV